MKKGIKTTIVSILAFLVILILLLMVYLGKMTSDELWKGFTAVGTTTVIFIGILSKDYNASHTKTNGKT